jgi:hypothetical protein
LRTVLSGTISPLNQDTRSFANSAIAALLKGGKFFVSFFQKRKRFFFF